MRRPRKSKSQKSVGEALAPIDAEFVPEGVSKEEWQKLNGMPDDLTEDEIRDLHEVRMVKLQTYLRCAERSSPEERYDMVNVLTDAIHLRFQEIIFSRLEWINHPNAALRAEALATITALQDQSNEIKKTTVALYEALGLGERKGFVGGKEVPKLTLPNMTDEKWKEKYGTPKGSA